METILLDKKYRRLFYLCSILVLIVLLFGRYALLPLWDPNISGDGARFIAHLTEDLTSSLVVTILIGSFLFFATPSVMRAAKVEAVEPKQINSLLKAASTTSTGWTLRGAMGRYTRAETLPNMIEQARNTGVRRKLTLIILDPENAQACRAYADYRNGVASASKKAQLSEELVQNHILATILSACNANLKEAMVDVQIHLVPTWSAIRIDLSDDYIILTSEDPREPGLRIDKGSQFYGTYSKELDFIVKQSRSLSLPNSTSGLKLTSHSDVTTILNHLGINLTSLDQTRCEQIYGHVVSKDHQYA